MKKTLCIACTAVLLYAGNAGFSQTVYDDSYTENPNYLKGIEYLNSSQYSSAVNEFKKALRADPKDESALIGLSNAYNLRAQYYSNMREPEKAASDTKSALFFNKYFRQNNSGAPSSAVIQMEKNLKILEPVQPSPEELVKRARLLRTRGEFAAAGYEYFRISANPSYKAEAAAALGDIFKIFNRPDKSIIFYQNALSADNTDAEVHLKLARAYEDMNDFNSSLKEYTYALNVSSEKEDILNSLERIWQKKSDENPNDAEAKANLGVIYQKEKRYSEALEEYKKAAALNPDNINTKINIGTLYQEQKKYEDALQVYDSVLQLQPQNINILSYKAECLKQLNRREEAASVYKKILQLDPKNTAAKTAAFSLLKDTMSGEELLAYLYQNVQNNPNDPAAYYEFAYELHKAGKTDDAVSYYTRAIQMDSSNIDAYINLSQCYRQKKNYAQADELLKKAAQIEPDNELVKSQIETVKKEYDSIIYSAAASYYEKGSYEAAAEMYLKIQPASAESYMGAAASYHAVHDNVKALEYYRRAMELDTGSADIPYFMAAIYADLNDINNADKYVKAALAKNPVHPQAKELSAYLASKHTETLTEQAVKMYEDEKYQQAAAMFDEIIKLNPDNASLYYYRALCSDAQKNYQKAINDYAAAVRLSPQMNIAYYSIAAAYDNMGRYKNAVEYYKRYVSAITDDNEYKQYAEARIKELSK